MTPPPPEIGEILGLLFFVGLIIWAAAQGPILFRFFVCVAATSVLGQVPPRVEAQWTTPALVVYGLALALLVQSLRWARRKDLIEGRELLIMRIVLGLALLQGVLVLESL